MSLYVSPSASFRILGLSLLTILRRFVFSQSATSRLQITKKSLKRLLSYHQVSPQYLEFLRPFRDQEGVPDLSVSGFRDESHLEHLAVESEMPDLGRSGQRFQMCYILRTMARRSNDMWSIRPASICHTFDLGTGTSFWLAASGKTSGLYDKVRDATSGPRCPADRDFSNVEASLRATLSSHILYARWALEDWAKYLEWVEDQVKHRVSISPVPIVVRTDRVRLHRR